MSRRQHARWLLDELPDLVKRGVLDTEHAGHLRTRYADDASSESAGKVREVLFALLGGLLIGGGVILLIAHNWADLSRPARTVLSVAPLLVGQLLAVFVVSRRMHSTAWREGVGVWWALAVGAGIALVAQTYHIPGAYESFLMTWMLLVLPLIYLLGSVAAAVIYMLGITNWVYAAESAYDHSLWVWPLAAAIVPFIVRERRAALDGWRATLLAWIAWLCLWIGLGRALGDVRQAAWTILYPAMFASLAAIDCGGRKDGNPWYQRPWGALGTVTAVGFGLVLSYRSAWRMLSYDTVLFDGPFHAETGVAVLLLAAWLVAVGRSWVTASPTRRVVLLAPLAAVTSYSLVIGSWSDAAPTLIQTGYVGVLGLALVREGISARRMGLVNGGTIAILLVILARFFDSDFGFVARGVAFVICGAVFLLVNFVLRAKTAEDAT